MSRSIRPWLVRSTLAVQLLGFLGLAGPLVAADGDPAGSGVVHFAGGEADGARAVAVQPDGKVVLAGTVTTGTGTFAVGLARFHPNGNLDFGFGNSGVVVDPFAFGVNSTGVALHRLPDGRLLVAGSLDFGNGDQDFYVGRLLESGAPDTTFGLVGTGAAYIAFDLGGDATDTLAAMAIDRSGRILLAGSVDVAPTDIDLGIVRLTPNGLLDTGFSGDGKLTVPASSGGADFGLALAVHPTGGMVVGGATWSSDLGGHFSMVLARVLADGSLDGSFGAGGITVFPYPLGGTNNAIVWGLGIWPDGEIVVAGDVATGAGQWKWALLTFSAIGGYLQGVLGPFCSVGIPPCPATPQDSPRALLIEGDDKILFAGFGPGPSGSTDFGVGRFHRDLAPDFGFGVDGTAMFDFDHGSGTDVDLGAAIALDRDGRILVAGSAEWLGSISDFAWVRFDSSYVFADGFDRGDGWAQWSSVVP